MRFNAPPPGNAKRLHRAVRLLQDDGIVEDSPVINICYEAHLSMEKMLAAFAELRGDDTASTIG
jgi:hypothetical protein